MPMAGMTPAFCAAQLMHSVEVPLGTCAKWLDGTRTAMAMNRLGAAFDGH
jgi:integrase